MRSLHLKSATAIRHSGFHFLLVAAVITFLIGSAAAQSGSPMGHSGQLPDPRFRKPIGLNELQNIVNMLVAKNDLHVRLTVRLDRQFKVPTARYSGSPNGHFITVNPRAAAEFPPNTWAFILGHEIAHCVDERARTNFGQTNRQIEWAADEIGASYAIRAGFCLEAHAGWVLSRPNRDSATYGSEHDRALNLVRMYRANWREIEASKSRYHRPLPALSR